MAAPNEVVTTLETHPAILQNVTLILRPTAGEPVRVLAKVLDLEPAPDGTTVLVVDCPHGWDPQEHHFDVTVSWTYPLGRMESQVSVRPARRPYGAVWELLASGPSSRLQQRAFFRAHLSVPALVRWEPAEADAADRRDGRDDPDGADPESASSKVEELMGVVTDLSEGGFMATVNSQPPPAGTAIEATVRIDGENLTQPARIIRNLAFANGGHGVAVAFDDPDVHGDRLRRVIFESERRRSRRR